MGIRARGAAGGRLGLRGHRLAASPGSFVRSSSRFSRIARAGFLWLFDRQGPKAPAGGDPSCATMRPTDAVPQSAGRSPAKAPSTLVDAATIDARHNRWPTFRAALSSHRRRRPSGTARILAAFGSVGQSDRTSCCAGRGGAKPMWCVQRSGRRSRHQRDLNHCLLTLCSEGPCDRGNPCRPRPKAPPTQANTNARRRRPTPSKAIVSGTRSVRTVAAGRATHAGHAGPRKGSARRVQFS